MDDKETMLWRLRLAEVFFCMSVAVFIIAILSACSPLERANQGGFVERYEDSEAYRIETEGRP
jgi:hypothetical protein